VEKKSHGMLDCHMLWHCVCNKNIALVLYVHNASNVTAFPFMTASDAVYSTSAIKYRLCCYCFYFQQHYPYKV
jgi:hypothetical protein